MIRRYDYGTPLLTDAVVLSVEPEKGNPGGITVEDLKPGIRFTLPMTEETQLFGLGQAVRGIDKRGHIYRSWNTDDVLHTENKAALYGSHNFLLIVNPGDTLGLFLDDPGDIRWDLGATEENQIVITSLGGDVSLYLIQDRDPLTVCRAFRGLIGKSYIPPFWAFGYIQSRWGYAGEEDITKVVTEHRQKHIPMDGICLDIDYMDRFRDFTWNPKTVPDPAGMVKRLREKNVHVIPIIDAGIPVDENDPACADGLKNDTFVHREDGSLFQAAVWPGLCYFTDYLNTRCRNWFGDLYRPMLEAGVDGFWNDMNEPSLFYSRDGLEAAWKEIDSLKDRNLGQSEFWALKRAVDSLANNPEDYRAFWHDMDGQKVRHDRVHNLYGAGMTKAAMDGMHRFDPDRRFLLFTRSSYIGSHRYGGIWTGDNCAWWSHLKLNLQMLPGLSMCGYLFSGADLGGFNNDTTGDLVLRWLELGIFVPLMRNHAALGTREKDICRFSRWKDMRNIVTLRYALLPFLYSEFLKAVDSGTPLFMPLAFLYPGDTVACHTQDQVMLTEQCMIAPVYEQNAVGRHVYLPEDMLMLRMRSCTDMDACVMEKGAHFVPCALNEALLFIRKGYQIPLVMHDVESTVDLRAGLSFTMAGWKDAQPYELWEDDGEHVSAPVISRTLAPGRGADNRSGLLR